MGVRRNVSAQELYDRVLSGTLEEVLNEVTPHRGEAYLIPPGLVHSATAGVEIAEVGESSDMDFRIYGWGRPVSSATASFTADPAGISGTAPSDDAEELSLEASFDFINMNEYDETLAITLPSAPLRTTSGRIPEDGLTDRLTSRREFTVNRIRLQEALHIYTERFGCFLAYLCVEGEASFQQPRKEGGVDEFILRKGETLLVPEEVPDFFIVPRDRSTILLEAFIEPRVEEDDYIDPDAEPRLRGEEDDEDTTPVWAE